MMNDDSRALRPLWWMLLAWVGLVYIEGLSAVRAEPSAETCQTEVCRGLTGYIPPVVAVTGLMLLFGAMLSITFLVAAPRRGRWLLFLMQWVIVLMVSQIVGQDKVVLSLCLALTLEAIVLLRQVLPVSIAAAGSVLLYVVTALQTIGAGAGSLAAWSGWTGLWNLLVLKTDFADLVLFTTGYLVLYILQTRAQVQRDMAYRKLQAVNEQLEAAHAELMTSAAEIEALTRLTERQRLARDLHDTLTQGLAGVIMQLEVANAHLLKQNHRRATEILQGAIGRARDALADARAAITDLRETTRCHADLAGDIQQEIERFTVATDVACESNLDALAALPSPLAEDARRALTEALMNVARHARARQVWVTAALRQGMVEVEVRDDGVGFDPAAVTADGHYGLLGLRERTQLAGGDTAVVSMPGTGTTVRFRFPAQPAGGQS